MRKYNFTNEEYYHVYNRGVDKREIYLNQRDYERFLYLLFTCNDSAPVLNSQFYYRGFASIVNYPKKRKELVDIVCFCLMPNHFHLILKQKVENGISLFMQKLGTGYTMYFNKKYNRSGILFQGVFKAIHIKEERYLTHLTRYIHLNPAELKYPDWKNKGFSKNAHEYIKKYVWSSYQDYLGKNRFHLILNKALMHELYSTPKQYQQFMKEWTGDDSELIEKYIIELP